MPEAQKCSARRLTGRERKFGRLQIRKKSRKSHIADGEWGTRRTFAAYAFFFVFLWSSRIPPQMAGQTASLPCILKRPYRSAAIFILSRHRCATLLKWNRLKSVPQKYQPMTKLEKKLRAALRRFGVGAQDSVIAAVSGGADSVALLDALARYQRSEGRPGSIIVAHLNHQLRGEESDEDEAFVRDLANQLNLSVFTERIAVAERAREEKQNLEAVARRLRYEFLLRVAEARGAKIVFTAHTLDDQAETILMRLIRGSGAEGLRGVHQVVALSDDVKLIRPMLGIKRAEVIAHCERYELAFRSDSSNFLADFTRNRIRLELLPMLKTFNPRVKQSLARASESLTRDEDYLRGAAVELLAKSREGSRLNAKVLQEASVAVRRRALRLWLRD